MADKKRILEACHSNRQGKTLWNMQITDQVDLCCASTRGILFNIIVGKLIFLLINCNPVHLAQAN